MAAVRVCYLVRQSLTYFTPAPVNRAVNFLDQWQQWFPTAEVERYPTANHYAFEDAREAMIERVRAFLD